MKMAPQYPILDTPQFTTAVSFMMDPLATVISKLTTLYIPSAEFGSVLPSSSFHPSSHVGSANQSCGGKSPMIFILEMIEVIILVDSFSIAAVVPVIEKGCFSRLGAAGRVTKWLYVFRCSSFFCRRHSRNEIG